MWSSTVKLYYNSCHITHKHTHSTSNWGRFWQTHAVLSKINVLGSPLNGLVMQLQQKISLLYIYKLSDKLNNWDVYCQVHTGPNQPHGSNWIHWQLWTSVRMVPWSISWYRLIPQRCSVVYDCNNLNQLWYQDKPHITTVQHICNQSNCYLYSCLYMYVITLRPWQ